MATIRIAHLSDLHFRRHTTKAPDVWREVCAFLNDASGAVDAIFITGDLTDNARPEEFEYARECLSRLTPLYRVIPGNHDRYLYLGNSAKPISGIWGLGWLARSKRGNFNQAFQGAEHVTPNSPSDINLGNWKIRVIGLDSSEEDEWFARGAVSDTSIAAACRAAAANVDCDLVIVLVHHHVLPIPEAEREAARHSLRAVANVTGLLNSGSLLNGLSKSHVNLILHGHEHYSNQARFRSGNDLSSEVVVLAAGSGTGEETGCGWALYRVHFNVIELHDNRNVYLRQVKWQDSCLSYVPGHIPLLTAEDIRRSRFLRRNRATRNGEGEEPRDLPRSRLKKVVEFNLARNINITEVRTDWVVQDAWTQATRNASGVVTEAIVNFEWAEREPKRFVVPFIQDHADPEEHKLRIPPDRLGLDIRKKALRVTSSWTWVGGAALTLRELDMLPSEAKGGYRAGNKEFAAICPTTEFEALSMTVRMPEQFAPDPRNVEVCYEKPNEPGKLYRAVELEKSLEFCGNGTIELQVPFPMPEYLYVIAWPVKDIPCVSEEAPRFAAAAARHASDLLNNVKHVLQNEEWFANASVALYTPEDRNPFMLKRLDGLGPAAPDRLALKDAHGLSRAAWWGEVAVIAREGVEDESDFLGEEKLLAMVPVRGREAQALGREALGILRIGLSSNPYSTMTDRDSVSIWMARFWAIIDEAAHFVLKNAQMLYGK